MPGSIGQRQLTTKGTKAHEGEALVGMCGCEEMESLSANHPFGYKQVRYPAEPRNDSVRQVEGPVQGEEHQWQLIAQGDGGEAEGEVANHPLTVRLDFSAANSAIGLESGEEPAAMPESEAEMSGQSFGRNGCHCEAGDGSQADREQIEASYPAMNVECASAQPYRELPWSGKKCADASGNVKSQGKDVAGEVLVGSLEDEVAPAIDRDGD